MDDLDVVQFDPVSFFVVMVNLLLLLRRRRCVFRGHNPVSGGREVQGNYPRATGGGCTNGISIICMSGMEERVGQLGGQLCITRWKLGIGRGVSLASCDDWK